jgi:subtilisin family serine protease
MQEPSMDFYFEPRRNEQDARRDGATTAPGLVTLPEALLQRHGARVLNPEDAVAIPDRPTPRSTAYRARTLLVPGFLLADTQLIESVNTVLARVGMRLEPTPAPVYAELERVNPDLAAALQALPRVAGLNPVRGDSDTAHPHVVDAWVALQTLREAATPRQPEPGQPEVDRDQTLLSKTDIDQFALEHLLISSSINGTGAHGTGGGLTPGAGGDGGTGAGPTDSYTFFSGDTRIPVAVCLDPPERRDAASEHGRRPVVAVLDTGIRAHPWLDVEKEEDGDGYVTDQSDGFVFIDRPMQVIIRDQGKEAVTAGDQQRQVIWYPWDKPVTADPLLGELDTDTGHCTFISGIVRQVAPDARVLAIRIMHSDGIVNEGDLLCALGLLVNRVALAQAKGKMDDMVDVASLSFGYFSEAEDSNLTSGLKTVIGKLRDLGVTVVAAAGNYSTSRKFYPAAFAQVPAPTDEVPLISVGALNPNDSQAVFSDGGRWITAWARGAIMISTFPVDIQGSLGPEIRMRMHPDNTLPEGTWRPERASLDPDDYRGGWAAWSGTSFSAPLVAAHIAKALLSKKLMLWLDNKGQDGASERAIERAVAALKSLRWEG